MPSVKVVTAYVDLGLTKRPSAEFHKLGSQLISACTGYGDQIRAFLDFQYDTCWAVRETPAEYAPANPTAWDRFTTVEEHRRSNLIQHSPLQWMQMAAQEDPADVYVWLGYSILKQGDFTGHRCKVEQLQPFLEKVARFDYSRGIPIPSIRPDDPLQPFGDNWQFVGSTLVIPRRRISEVSLAYHTAYKDFLMLFRAVPLDLAIWPMVVRQHGLPFLPYGAEYDATQWTNFPG